MNIESRRIQTMYRNKVSQNSKRLLNNNNKDTFVAHDKINYCKQYWREHTVRMKEERLPVNVVSCILNRRDMSRRKPE